MAKTMVVAGKYIRIILSQNVAAFTCIWVLYGGLDAWSINTEIPGMTMLFLEHGNCLQDFNIKSSKGPGNTFELNPKWTRTLPLGNLDFCTSSPQQGVKCQLQYLEFFWRGGLYKYTMKNSQRQSGHLTDLSCWVEFCTSNPKQGVQCQPRYLDFLFGRGVL